MPKEYVKTSDIIKEKVNLYNSFNTYFNCEIEKIKLIYFTGIYFINKESGIYIIHGLEKIIHLRY